MAKEFENEFFKELQNSVVKDEPEERKVGDKLEDLISRKEQLERTLEEMKANVIVDPREVKKIEKAIKDLEKAIESGRMDAPTEAEIETDKEAKEEEEEIKKEEEQKEEQQTQEEEVIKEEEEQIVEKQERSEILKEEYYAALVALYDYRIGNIELAKKQRDFVTSRESFEKEMMLEDEMYKLREEYMAMGFEDPFKAKRTELIAAERDAKEPIELALREKARKFRLLQEEITRMDKEENEIHQELLNPDISSVRMDELNKRLEELGEKRKGVELQLADIRKDLEPAIEERKTRSFVRAGLEMKHFETLTDSDKANYVYQQSKVQTMNANTEKAITQEYRNLKLRIEEREYHIKELKRELERTPATDFERKLELLGKLDKEATLLEMDKESKSDMDLGIRPKENERKREVIEKFEKEEARQEEFDKDTRAVRDVIEEQNRKTGEKVVSEPAKEIIEDKQRSIERKAATYAMVKENESKPGPDTVLDDVKQYAVAKCVIEGLEDKVQDINDPAAAQAYLDQDTTLGEASREIQEKQEEIEEKIG